jgi:hypothetical protein
MNIIITYVLIVSVTNKPMDVTHLKRQQLVFMLTAKINNIVKRSKLILYFCKYKGIDIDEAILFKRRFELEVVTASVWYTASISKA